MFHVSRTLLIGATALMVGAGTVAGTNGTSLAGAPAKTPATPTPSKHPHRVGLYQRLVDLTATQTGQTEAQVRAELRTGKSLNDIAGAKAGAVERSVLDALKTGLDKAVSAHKITKEKETDLLTRATTRLNRLMARHRAAKVPAAAATPAPTASPTG